MAKPTIVTRAGKGSALTFTEGDANFTNLRDATITVSDGTTSTAIDLNGTITFTAGSGISVDESSGTITITNTQSAGATDLDGLTDVQITTPSNGQILSYSSSSSKWENVGTTFLSNISEDTTPQLGGTLDGQGQIVSFVELKKYKETVYNIGSNDSPTLDYANGNVQTVSITSGLSLPAFSSAAAGQSITLIVTGTGTASGTGSHKFAGGSKTLTNYSVISIFYDGTTYWTSIATDFQA